MNLFLQVKYMSILEFQSMEECEQVCTQTKNKPIVLDFSASWCGPCKRVYPILQELAHKYPNVLFYKVDVDDLPDVSNHFGIESVPSFKFVLNNKIVGEFAGADVPKLKKTIAELA